MRTVAFLALLSVSSTEAFAPSVTGQRVATDLAASRREVFAGVAAAAAATMGVGSPAQAANNPALQTFKGKKGSKNQYIPGKGLKQHEDDVLVAASNPALQTLKAKKGSKNQYIPGRGLKQHDDDVLVAASNPALQTLKAKKGSKNQYIPGRGLKQHEDMLVAASNPALQTLKAKKGSKNQYIPGKGLKMKDVDILV